MLSNYSILFSCSSLGIDSNENGKHFTVEIYYIPPLYKYKKDSVHLSVFDIPVWCLGVGGVGHYIKLDNSQHILFLQKIFCEYLCRQCYHHCCCHRGFFLLHRHEYLFCVSRVNMKFQKKMWKIIESLMTSREWSRVCHSPIFVIFSISKYFIGITIV